MGAQATTPTRIGRYDVIERLAIGGMAEVFLAVEHGAHGFQRLVVVKRILPHLIQYDQMVRMFLQEARLAAGITHPNVVQILELGEDGSQPYIAMEYVAGVTVKDLATDAKRLGRELPVAVVVQMIAQACAGAHAAHELRDPTGRPSGLVHRDLSPHNLIIDAQGHLKLLDFGIAKAADDADHTRTGVLKGKIRYMSPEQCHQLPLDRRSDLFTLAIVMWELLAGERLFERQTELETMQTISAGTLRDLRLVRPDVPEAIVGAMEHALRVRPEERWPNGDLMRRGLLDAAQQAGITPTEDVVAAFVEEVVGARLAARRRTIEGSLEGRPTPLLTLDPGSGPSESSLTLTEAAAPFIGVMGLLAGALAVAVVLITIGIGTAWWYSQDGAKAETTRVPDTPLVGPTVTIALAPVNDTNVMLTDYEPLRVWLERKTGHPIRLLPAPTYADAGRWLVESKVDLAVLPPGVYIEASNANAGVKAIAMKLFDGSTGTDGVILVRDDSQANTAKDLIGKTVCMADPGSSTGYLLPRAWLRNNGVDVDGAPERGVIVRITGNHFQSIRDLEQGLCDAAGTYSGAWMAAEEAGISPARFRVLAITGRTPHDAFCAAPNADPVIIKQLSDALLGLDTQHDLGVDRVGEAERITGFVAVDDKRWDDLRKAYAAERSKKPK
jgi:phosphate/phosphite/phosphonate ABC transporter binding protein